MVRKSFMIIAGETSGDILGAELVPHLRDGVTADEGVPSLDRQPLRTSLEPEFFGAGGPCMAAAGVDIAIDMTEHAVVGLWEVIKKYQHFRQVLRQLVQLAIRRQPDVIICIDFSGFNLRFAHAIRRYVRARSGAFENWRPRLVQYVSPQVWASRPQRAEQMGKDINLLVSIFPFEPEWYSHHAPRLRVKFVGHPLIDRYAQADALVATQGVPAPRAFNATSPNIVLLPGSRTAELKRHVPVMFEALDRMRSAKPGLRAVMMLPNERLKELASSFQTRPGVTIETGGVSQALTQGDLAIACTGTVALECACFGVPTVAIYKTSPLTYRIAQRLIQVKFLAMPNLLAEEEVFPEFLQDAATPDNIAAAALELLDNPERRALVRQKLSRVVDSLGGPGASRRAAEAILEELNQVYLGHEPVVMSRVVQAR